MLATAMSTMIAQSYSVAGKAVQCPHCGGTVFATRKILLNTRGATFFSFDWLNKGATVLTCARCGRLEWFANELRAVDDLTREP